MEKGPKKKERGLRAALFCILYFQYGRLKGELGQELEIYIRK